MNFFYSATAQLSFLSLEFATVCK